MLDLSVLIWPVFGVLAIIAVALPLWVFFRTPKESGESPDQAQDRVPALRVYQDQLAGIDNDLRWGRISESQADEMRLEIKRRMLRVADKQGAGESAKAMSGILVSAIVVAGVIGGLTFYLLLGSPHLAGVAPRPTQQALASPGGAGAAAENSPSMEDVLAKLAVHLESNPDDIRALSLMARSLWETGQLAGAADMFSRLAALEPDNIDHRISLGEVLLDSMGGRMTPAAQQAFIEASRINPDHPAPIFYAGLSHYQAGDALSALQVWRDLAEQSPAEAPWLPNLAEQIRMAEQQLGVPSEAVPGMPTPDANSRQMVENMSDDQREAFIASMVARLEEKLAEDPDDLDGWLNLARAYRVLNRNNDAKAALQRAMAIAPDDMKPRIATEIANLE